MSAAKRVRPQMGLLLVSQLQALIRNAKLRFSSLSVNQYFTSLVSRHTSLFWLKARQKFKNKCDWKASCLSIIHLRHRNCLGQKLLCSNVGGLAKLHCVPLALKGSSWHLGLGYWSQQFKVWHWAFNTRTTGEAPMMHFLKTVAQMLTYFTKKQNTWLQSL